MPIIEREGNPVLGNLRRNIQMIGSGLIQKQLQEQQRKQELQDAIKKAVITSVLTGKGKFKTPVNMQDIITGGELPNLDQFHPINTPTTSISISPISLDEKLKARTIQSQSPEEWYRLGMAKGKGDPQKVGGFLGMFKQPQYLKNEKGENIINLPAYSEYELSPEALATQTDVAEILQNPYRITKRLGYRDGGDIDFDAIEDTENTTESYTSEQEQIIQEAMNDNPGRTKDEIIAQLIERGYL